MKRLIVILIALFLIILALPTLLSIHPIFERVASFALGAPVKAESASLGWFTSEIKGLQIEGERTFTADKVKVLLSPFESLIRLRPQGELYADQFTLKEQESETSGHLAVERRSTFLKLHTSGKTAYQGQTGEFDVTLSLPPLESFKRLFSALQSRSDWTLQASFKSMPTSLLGSDLGFCSLKLGELVGPVIDLDISAGEGRFVSSIRSEAIEGSIAGEWKEERLSLSDASKLRYVMPEEAQKILKETRELPILLAPVNLIVEPTVSPKLQLHLEEALLGDRLKIRKTRGFLTVNQELSRLSLDLSSTLEDGGVKGEIASQINFEPLNREWSLSVSATKFPTTLFSDYFGTDDLPIDLWMRSVIGPSINFSMEFYRDEGITAMRGSAENERIKTGMLEFRFDRDLYRLVQPAQLKLQLSLAPPLLGDVSVRAQDLLIQLQRLSYKRRKGCALSKVEPDQLSLAALISSKEAFATNVPYWGNLSVTNSLLEVSGNSLSELSVNLISKVQFVEDLQLSLKGEGGFQKGWTLSLPKVELKGEGRHINLLFTGKEDSSSTLHAAGQFHLLLTENSIERLTGVKLRLTSPAIVQGVLESAELPLNNLKESLAKGRLLAEELSIGSAALKKLALDYQLNGKEQEFHADLKGETALAGKKGSILAKVSITGEEEKIEGSGEVKEFPLAFLNLLLPKSSYTALLPETASGALTLLRETKGVPMTVRAKSESEELHFSAALELDKEIRLSEPATLSLLVTKEAFQRARKELRPSESNRIALEEPLKLDAALSSLTVPLSAPETAQFTLNLEAEPFKIHLKESIAVDQLKATISTEDFVSEVYAKVMLSGKTAIPFSGEFTASLRDLLTPDGDWNKRTASLFLTGSTRETPIIAFAELFFLNPRFIDQVDALLGERLSSELSLQLTQMTGPIHLELMGLDGWIRMQGNVHSSILTLTEPLTAEFTASPRMSASVLDELLPLLRTAESGTQPISLEIAPQGFSYAIWGDPVRDLTIDYFKIDLGKLTFRNQERIQELLELLRVTQDPAYTTVWFTPVFGSFRGGVAKLRRFDMLVADRYPIALWGQVDFLSDNVNMTIGLGGKTLRRAFNLKAVPDDYYLQIALKGTTDGARIDIKSSATRVAAFVSQFRSGPQGILLGAFLDIINASLGQKKTPKPTTSPFPWDR